MPVQDPSVQPQVTLLLHTLWGAAICPDAPVRTAVTPKQTLSRCSQAHVNLHRDSAAATLQELIKAAAILA